jgi:hypothetical protein
MSILTKPALVEKGVAAEFELDKAALAVHPIVSANTYFASPNNWAKIHIKFKSDVGGQFEVVEFDATIAEPIGRFFVSETGKDIFQVEKITIIDHDGGILVIPRADLTVAEFDIDFNPAAPQIGNPIIWDTFLSGAIAEADGGISGGAGNNMIKSNASKVLNGADFKVTYNFTMIPGSDDLNLVHGIMNSISDTGFAGLTGITYQSSTDILIYDNYSGAGAPQATFSNSMMNQNGSNTAIFEKVGNVLTIKMNGVTIYTKNNHTEQTMVPAVRTWAIQAIDSGYMLSAANTIQAVTWNVAGKTGVGTVTAGVNGSITKSAGGAGYNVNVLSNETITGDGYVEFINSSIFVNVVFGLAEVNSSSGSFDNIIIGGYFTGAQGLEKVYNDGVTFFYGGTVGPIVAGDIIRFERVGTTYSIKINGTQVYSISNSSQNPLKASVTIYGETFGVNNVTIAS